MKLRHIAIGSILSLYAISASANDITTDDLNTVGLGIGVAVQCVTFYTDHDDSVKASLLRDRTESILESLGSLTNTQPFIKGLKTSAGFKDLSDNRKAHLCELTYNSVMSLDTTL